jgi:hypothetical protein
MLYLFHNFVNKSTKKQIFNFSDTKKYKDVNISEAFGLFYNLYYNNLYLRKSANYNKMILVINDINKFIKENIFYYNKIQIKKEINCLEEEVIVIEKEVIDIEKEEVIDIEKEEVIDIEKEEVIDIEKEEVIDIEKEEVIDIEKEEVIVFNNKINKSKISLIDDSNLPSIDLTLPEAMIEMMKNIKCIPYKVYVERWTYLKKIKDKKINIIFKEQPTVNDNFLPSIDLTLPVAMEKIKGNKKCVPFELYVKRWNELKTLYKHKKKFS